eukprot:582214-Prymnesium_polylepis.1
MREVCSRAEAGRNRMHSACELGGSSPMERTKPSMRRIVSLSICVGVGERDRLSRITMSRAQSEFGG